MSRGRWMVGLGGGALVASLFALVPATLASTRDAPLPRRAAPVDGIGSFTPAATDARLAEMLSRSGMSGTGFRFTPAASVRLNRSVTVAVRAQSNRAGSRDERAALVAPSAPSIMPVAYNLGVAVGWRKFAVSGDVAQFDIAGIGRKQVADVGVSYNARRFSGRVQVGAERNSGPVPSAIVGGNNYSVDVGGSYSLTRNLDVTAGVRYRTSERDRLVPQTDDRRDSQAVYLGTAFRF